MKITEPDSYHGSGLTQIVEHPSFKALNRGSGKYGHYLINTDRHVFAKYRKSSPWQFTFQPDDLKAIREAGAKTFAMLVCGRKTICGLTLDEIKEVLDLDSAKSQFITIQIPPGGSCHVKGSKGKLKKTITHNAFPKKLFT
jgi:hypothetical protein